MSWMHVADPLIKHIALMHYHCQKYHRKLYLSILQSEKENFEIKSMRLPSYKSADIVDLNIVDFANRDDSSILYREKIVYDAHNRA